MRNKALLAALALCAGAFDGCGAARPANYYQLTPEGGAGARSDRGPFAVALLLSPMTTSQLYRDDRIVYTSEGEAMGRYEFQRWAEPAPDMIDDVLLRKLDESGRFQHVGMLRSNARGDYLLRGQLYDFREVDGKLLVARVAFVFELRDTKTGATVWTHKYAHDEAVSERNVSAVAAAIDRNVHQGLDEVVESLEQYFSSVKTTAAP
ncbi:MAG TPA: ABC-type transport auxiliary lipoprotein family protein [Candidatus Acidoferrum sp.]|nr:ABC-type transport auxiliary lipoprotein family protein [Candidatus Acidoferrum sp.]